MLISFTRGLRPCRRMGFGVKCGGRDGDYPLPVRASPPMKPGCMGAAAWALHGQNHPTLNRTYQTGQDA